MSRGTPRQHPSAPASRRPAPPCRPCTCRRKYFCAGLKNIFVTTYIPGDLGGRIRVAGLAVELQLLADGGVGELGAGRGVVGGVGGVAEEEAGVARLEVNLRRGEDDIIVELQTNHRQSFHDHGKGPLLGAFYVIVKSSRTIV